jgi:iron complex transport system substrate-binding protein
LLDPSEEYFNFPPGFIHIDKAIEELNKKVPKDKTALIALTDDKELTVYGENSRFGIIHNEFGVVPVDKNIKAENHGDKVSFEYVLEKKPDYLLVIDGSVAFDSTKPTAKQLVENELVKRTTALKEGKVIYLDANYWYLASGGLTSVSEMVKEVSKGF